MAIDKVVDSTVLDGYFSDIADAIRAKVGGSDVYTPVDMPPAIENIPSGGGDEGLDALLAGTATGDVTINATSLAAVEILILYSTEYGCYNTDLVALHAPNLTQLGVDGSRSSGSRVTGGINASSGKLMNLEVLDIPRCRLMEITCNSGSASNKAKLHTINAPALECAAGVIRYTNITQMDFPELVKWNSSNYAFADNTLMTKFRAPKLTNIGGDYMFKGCSALAEVDFTSYPNIPPNMFQNCSALRAVILRRTTLTTLGGTGAFNGTPVASGTGYIYVPRALVSTYQAATNWSTYAAQFRTLEDYTDDGTIDGEFIPPA